jgi:hypothetical protein
MEAREIVHRVREPTAMDNREATGRIWGFSTPAMVKQRVYTIFFFPSKDLTIPVGGHENRALKSSCRENGVTFRKRASSDVQRPSTKPEPFRSYLFQRYFFRFARPSSDNGSCETLISSDVQVTYEQTPYFTHVDWSTRCFLLFDT